MQRNWIFTIVRKKTIVLGLSIHFVFWWAYFAWLWLRVGERVSAERLFSIVGKIAIAPAQLGLFYLMARNYWKWAIAGIAISIGLIFMSYIAVRKQTRWVVLLTHLIVLLYWLTGSVLIASGE